MSELAQILKEEYNKTMDQLMDPQALMQLIEETLDQVYDNVVVTEASTKVSKGKEFLLVLPKFTPTEAWGDPESMERAQIERLFNVVGGGRTIQGKLAFLQQIAAPDNKITSPRRIISSLIILESLSAVVTSFNAASAGFVFEGFIAALLQGEQVGEVSAKGNLPIQDLIAFTESDDPLPISLKLLGLKTNIEGSYTNLVDGLAEFGRMVYVVARKDGEKIAIEEFTLTQDNFIDALTLSAKGRGKAAGLRLFKIVGTRLSAEESIEKLKATSSWDEKYKLLQHTAGYSERVRRKRQAELGIDDAPPFGDDRPAAPQASDTEDAGWRQAMRAPSEEELTTKQRVERYYDAKRRKGARLTPQEIRALYKEDMQQSLTEIVLEEWSLLTEAGGHTTQWMISPPQLSSFGFVDYKKLGTLAYSPEQIEAVAEMHMDKLNGELTAMFTATHDLSENITKYFTFEKRSRAIGSGEKAIENTIQIQDSLRTQISAPDSEPE